MTDSDPPPPTGNPRPSAFLQPSGPGEVQRALPVIALLLAAMMMLGAAARNSDRGLAFAIGSASGSLIIPGVAFLLLRRKNPRAGWIALLVASLLMIVVTSLPTAGG